MKYYIVEPSYKKSFIEFTAFNRIGPDGERMHLTKELGWRWGSFLFSVPDTEDEAMEFLKQLGYEGETAVIDWAIDHGHTITNDDGDEVLPEDFDLVETVKSQSLPSESEEFVDITEDYPNAEFVDAWDGCWEYWNISSYPELDEEEKDAMIEEIEAAYEENYDEGVEDLGWTFSDTYYELHCAPKITECDERGNKLNDEDQTQSDI